MKRPAAYILTAAILIALISVNDILLYVSPLLAGIFLFMLLKPRLRAFGCCLLIVCAAVFLNCTLRQNHIQEINRYDDCSVRLLLTVTEYPEISEGTVRAVCRIKDGPIGTKGEKLLLEISEADERFLYNVCEPGSVIETVCTVKIPTGSRNPGGFDYSLYLKTKGIYTAAYSNAADTVKTQEKFSVFRYLYRIKNAASNVFYRYCGKENASLAESVLFGTQALSEETLEDFRSVGIAHVLAVSGLHTAMVFSVVAFLLKAFKVKPKTKLFASIAALIFYCALTGFSVSVIRASVMISFAAFSGFSSRKTDRFNSLCIAALAVVLVNPLCIYSASFCLSFSAVAAIVLFMPYISNRLGLFVKNKRLLKVSSYAACCVVVSLFLVVLNACFFNYISYISPIANILTVPLIGIIITLCLIGLALSFLPPVAFVIFRVCDVLMTCIRSAASYMASLSFGGGYIKSLRGYEIIAFYALLLLVFGYIGIKHKKQRFVLISLAVLVCVSLGFSTAERLKPKIDFLDVDFGDCCVITAPGGEHIMIDTAKEYYADEIISYLEHEDIHKLEYVIITHSDADHAGGLYNIMEHFDVDCVMMNDDGSEICRLMQIKAYECGAEVKNVYTGDSILLKGFELHVIAPERENYYTSVSDNERSVVCSVYEKGVCILMTGDMTEGAVNKLVTEIAPFNVDIFKVPHHGSRIENIAEFCAKYQVKNAVISVGNNPYSLPNEKTALVLERMTNLYTTQKNGCVRVSFPKQGGYRIQTMSE